MRTCFSGYCTMPSAEIASVLSLSGAEAGTDRAVHAKGTQDPGAYARRVRRQPGQGAQSAGPAQEGARTSAQPEERKRDRPVGETSPHRLAPALAWTTPSVLTMVVAQCVLVQVGPQPLRGDGVEDAAQPTLDERPEALHGLDMNVAANVNTCRGLDALVGADLKPVPPFIDAGFVRC
jgi:hypothetical protein